MKNNIVIRLEEKSEYRKVENLVRDSFWNVYRPGCLEHYVLNQLRNDPAFVPELDFVMYQEGELIGQNRVSCDVWWSDAKDCSYGDRKNYTDVLVENILTL